MRLRSALLTTALTFAAALTLPTPAFALPGTVDFSFFRGDVRVWSFAGCDFYETRCFDVRVEVGRRRAVGAGEVPWAVRAFVDGRITDSPFNVDRTIGGAGFPSGAWADFRGTPWGEVLNGDGDIPPDEPVLDVRTIDWSRREVSADGRRASDAGDSMFRSEFGDLIGASFFVARPLYFQLTYVTYEGTFVEDSEYELPVTGDRIERDPTLATVPEPSTVALVGAGLGAAGLAARRRRRA